MFKSMLRLFLYVLSIALGYALYRFSIQSFSPIKPVGELRTQERYTYFEQEALRFFVIGDQGSGNESQLKVAASMDKLCATYENGIHGLMLLGDNFYPRGVSSDSDPQWDAKVQVPYGLPCLKKAPIYPVLGNHDYKGNPNAQIQYSLKDPRWHMPHRFYLVDFSQKLRLIGFDSGFPDVCLSSDLCSVNFLQESLADSSATWNIVMSHHPLSSASPRGYGYAGGIFGFLMRPLVCSKTHVWLSGHSHHLEHRKIGSCDSHMFVVGGGGGDLYEVPGSDPSSLFLKSSFGFLELVVWPTRLEATFYNENGEKLYSSAIDSYKSPTT